MKTRTNQEWSLRSMTIALTSVSLVAAATGADSCIISGSTVAQPASVSASAGIAVCTDRISVPTPAVSLDSRDRTQFAAEPIGIDPTLAHGLIIYLR